APGLRDRAHRERQGSVLHGGSRRVASQGAERGANRERPPGAVSMSQATQTAALHDCRRAFADTLIALAREDERIVAVCADSVGPRNLTPVKAACPARR